MLNDDLRAQLDDAAGAQPFVPTPQIALRRARRIRLRRRRLHIAAAVTAVIAAAIAVPIAVTSNSGSGSNQIVPAGPISVQTTAPVYGVRASLYGVTVRWLPPGMSWTREVTAQADNYSPQTVLTFFDKGTATGPLAPSISLSIRRGYIADLDSDAQAGAENVTWKSVHGNRALLRDTSGQDADGARHFTLTWSEAGTTIELVATAVTVDDLQRTADAVTVGSPTQPKNPAAAKQAAAIVVAAAFNGGTPLNRTLDSIEDGQRLQAAVTTFRRNHAAAWAATRFTVLDVVVIDATTVVVRVNVPAAYFPSGITPSAYGLLNVENENGSWKIPARTYCDALLALRPSNCPGG